MKKFLPFTGLFLALVAQLAILPLHAQNDWLIFQKGNRTKILKPEHMVAIALIYDIAGDSLDCAQQRVSGKVLEVSKDSVEMEVIEEQVNYTKANKVSENNLSQYPAGRMKMKLPLYEIDHVNYQSNTSQSFQMFGAFLTTVGMALIVVSPAMGLETKDGSASFNNDRFAGWAKAGLIGIGFGTPMIWLGRKHTLHLTFSKKKKKVWSIKPR